MPQTNWPRVEELFHELVDRPPGDHEAFLSSEPESIRRAVLGMLRNEQAEALISTTLRRAAQMLSQPEERIGAYKILKELGRGGMGTVYLGARADSTYDKQVAIKFVRQGMDSPELRARFDAERRILARLQHPNIANLLDAGTTPSGLPYFVMEFVDGQPVHKWVSEANLSLRDRLQLFLRITEAVRYAHQNLVIHRDLKPGNILVTSDGTPKLLDFGIAKLLAEDYKDSQQTVIRILTPDYASPEQARGEAISIATDIYSLGAILYQLLTGSPPLRLKGLSSSEAEHRVANVDPPIPSSLPCPFATQLRGDLDTIILKALRKNPNERYPTVDAFREDIERFLSGHPIEARQYSFRERAARFARRHRTASLASAAIALSLIIGSTLALTYAIRAEKALRIADTQRELAQTKTLEAERRAAEALEQRHIADSQRALAERRFEEQRLIFGDSIKDFYNNVQTLAGSTPARLKLLNMALASVEKLAHDAPNDSRIQLDLANYHDLLGELHGTPTSAGLRDRELGLSHLQKALAITSRELNRDPGNHKALLTQSNVLIRIGAIQAYNAENAATAKPSFSRALQSAERLAALAPKDSLARGALINALVAPNMMFSRRDARLVDSTQLERGKRLARALLATDPDHYDAQTRLSEVLSIEVNLHSAKLEYEQSLQKLIEIRSIRRRLLERTPNDASIERMLMLTNSHLADLFARLGQGTSAEAREAVLEMGRHAEHLATADPGNATAQYDLAMSLSRIAAHWRREKQFYNALNNADRSLAILDRLRTREQSNRVFFQQYMAGLYTWAITVEDTGSIKEASVAYERLLHEWDIMPSADTNPDTLATHCRSLNAAANFLTKQNSPQALSLIEKLAALSQHLEASAPKASFNQLRAIEMQARAGLLYARWSASSQPSLWPKVSLLLTHVLEASAPLDFSRFPDWSPALAQSIQNTLAMANKSLSTR